MEETLTSPSPATPSRVWMLLEHLALPAFAFSAALVALLTLSLFLLLPPLTRVKVGATERDAGELQAYWASLSRDVTTLAAQRDDAMAPVKDPSYRALAAKRDASSFDLPALREQILRTAASLVPEQGAIAVSSFALRGNQLTVEGDVRNVGTRSMTVLAQFSDQLGALPFTASVIPPLFERLEDPTIGMHSPFRIVLTLR